MRRATRLFALLERMQPRNEMIFELYYRAGDEFFATITRSVPTWAIEITLESPDERVRRRNGKFPWSNAVFERTVERALAHGCRKIDVFFMVGLPGQARDDARAIGDYCAHLLERFGADRRVHPFVAPLGPFLDPGSRAFEQPEFGYTTIGRTLQDYERASGDAGADHEAPAAELAHHRTMFGDDELKWPVEHRFRVGRTLLQSLATGLVEEVRHTAARAMNRYDVAPASRRGSTG
jgi:hypothetical protein